MCKRSVLAVVLLFAFVLASCSDDSSPAVKDAGKDLSQADKGSTPDGPLPSGPPLYIVSMMQTEADTPGVPFNTDEETFQKFAKGLRDQSDFLVKHGAKLSFGPDGTFIEGLKKWDPSILTDVQAAGHEIHSHTLGKKYDLGQVNEMLAEVGIESHIASGGYEQTGPDDSNWIGYVSAFKDASGAQLFDVAVGFRIMSSGIKGGPGYAYRPSTTGDWTIPDPKGPIIYLGTNIDKVVQRGTGVSFSFEDIQSFMDEALANVEPDKVNTLYWHESLHGYYNDEVSQGRRDKWDKLFKDYLDPLVASGRIEWKTFSEMVEIYRQSE